MGKKKPSKTLLSKQVGRTSQVGKDNALGIATSVQQRQTLPRPRILLTQEAIKKVRSACAASRDREWMGWACLLPTSDSKTLLLADVYAYAVGSGADVNTEENEQEQMEQVVERWIERYGQQVITGKIHSHVNMGVFSSHVDVNNAIENAGTIGEISIVTNNKLEFVAFAYVRPTIDLFGMKIPGEAVRIDIDVDVLPDPDINAYDVDMDTFDRLSAKAKEAEERERQELIKLRQRSYGLYGESLFGNDITGEW